MIVHDRRYMLTRALERFTAGCSLRPVVFTEGTESAREFVSAGLGITIMPRMALANPSVNSAKLTTVPLQPEWTRMRVVVIRRADERPTPASHALVRLMRDAAVRLAERMDSSS